MTLPRSQRVSAWLVGASSVMCVAACSPVVPGQVYVDDGITGPAPVVYYHDEDPAPRPGSETGGGAGVAPPGALERADGSVAEPSGSDAGPRAGAGRLSVRAGLVIASGDRPVELADAPAELVLPEFTSVAYVHDDLPQVAAGQVLVSVGAGPEDTSRWFAETLGPPVWSGTTVERMLGRSGTVYRVRTVARDSAAGPVLLVYDVYADGQGGSTVVAEWDYFWQPAATG